MEGVARIAAVVPTGPNTFAPGDLGEATYIRNRLNPAVGSGFGERLESALLSRSARDW
jgi:hypothetical protein